MSSWVKALVQPEQIGQVWAWMRPKLEEIAQSSPVAWMPEDVYCEIKERRAYLWLALKENQPVAFCVMQPSKEALHVWAGWAEWSLDGAMELAKEIATEAKVKRLTFSSLRPGWEKVAPEFGFKPIQWACEV